MKVLSHKLVGLGAAALIAGAVGTAAATGNSAHGKPHVAQVARPRVPPEVPKEPSYPIQIPAGAEDPASADATGADERAQANFSDVYGGLELINNGTHVVISLTTLDPRIEAAVRGDAPASEFTFVLARRSGAWLEALTQRIGDDQAAQDAAGVQLIKEGDGDAQTGRLLVQVLNLTPAKTSWLNARYGADNLKVIDGTAADIPVATRLDLAAAPGSGVAAAPGPKSGPPHREPCPKESANGMSLRVPFRSLKLRAPYR